jgi:hypothetical protein
MALFFQVWLLAALFYLWVRLVRLALEADHREEWVQSMRKRFADWNR